MTIINTLENELTSGYKIIFARVIRKLPFKRFMSLLRINGVTTPRWLCHHPPLHFLGKQFDFDHISQITYPFSYSIWDLILWNLVYSADSFSVLLLSLFLSSLKDMLVASDSLNVYSYARTTLSRVITSLPLFLTFDEIWDSPLRGLKSWCRPRSLPPTGLRNLSDRGDFRPPLCLFGHSDVECAQALLRLIICVVEDITWYHCELSIIPPTLS